MKNINLVLLLLFMINFACKSKTELYLERGLDILSNKQNVNFNIYKNIVIDEIGVIRDQKENTKTLVFKMDNSFNGASLDKDIIIGIRVWIVNDKGEKRIENWDFKPQLIEVDEYKYLLKEISLKENELNKINTYND